MPRSYSITTDSISEEQARVGADSSDFDISRVIRLETVEIPEVGPQQVRLKILAVSAEHNVDHAAWSRRSSSCSGG